jgi:NADPH-dependent glutamate synthase beta subunit-like oxidoreductase/ferredoxin
VRCCRDGIFYQQEKGRQNQSKTNKPFAFHKIVTRFYYGASVKEGSAEKRKIQACPVSRLLSDCTRLSQKLLAPQLRKAIFPLSAVLEKISLGKALPEDLLTMASLGKYLESFHQETAVSLGSDIDKALSLESACFDSHIKDHICPTGDCEFLLPAPCQCACPAGIDVASYVALIGQGKDREAITLIREANPFPWVCGLVCTHPCEAVCVRKHIDTPVAIKALKEFASKIVLDKSGFQNPAKDRSNGHKVCIVGAGPSGLSAAYFLSLKGYEVTVIEALPYAGGMMRVGIPRYRLPISVLEREISLIQDLGVVFRFNTRLGKNTTVEDLIQEGFESFYVATGAHKGLQMGIKGEADFPQVMDAITYLHQASLDRAPSIGPRVAVVGGGNVALDAARTALRLGCSDVHIIYRRTRNEMPALAEEITLAEQEGVRLSFLKIPVEVMGCQGNVSGIRCIDTRLGEADESGRRRPIPIQGSLHEIETDTVIHAIGQQSDREGFSAFKGLMWTERSTIEADPLTGQTGDKRVFAGGDAVTGPATIIEAIAAGKIAAYNIDRYFQGLPMLKTRHLAARGKQIPFLETTAAQKISLTRPMVPRLDIEKRKKSFEQVELTLLPETARTEALRCLRCDVCIRCGRCVDACREKLGFEALCLGYVDSETPGTTDFSVTDKKCILCGACANGCLTGALTLKHENGQSVLSLCGITLCQDKLATCNNCGEILGAERFISYMEKKVIPYGIEPEAIHLCRACKRMIAENKFVTQKRV